MPARVSLCAIVKNEEANLPSCLESVADLVHEIVVVDTGSTDRTREVAQRLGARVFDFTWVNDFAAARNESLRHATGDWIVWLDGDEHFDETNRQRLRALFDGLGQDNAAYIMRQRSISDPVTGEARVFEQVRLFRNLPRHRWQNRVHEQILPSLEQSGAVLRWTDVVIEHSGYEDAALHRRKQERNLALLQLQNTERPDDSFTLFNLGLTYHVLDRTAEAVVYWRRSLERAHPANSWTRKLYALLGEGHRQLGKHEEALAICRAGLTRYPDDPEMLYQLATMLGERGDLAGAEACLTRLLQAPPGEYFAAGMDVGLRGHKARHALGMIYRTQQRHAEAENQWRTALAERPDYAPTCLELGNLYLVQGRWEELEQVARRLEASGPGKAAAAHLRARKHFTCQDFPAARHALEEALAAAPRNLELQVLLSRVLLAEGRDWNAAEQALRNVLALDPYHAEGHNNLTVLQRQRNQPRDPIPISVATELFQRAEKTWQAGNLADAATLYRPLFHAGFLPGVMLHRLAAIANAQGDFAGAWELHLQAIAVDPALASRITAPDCPHHGVVCRQQYDLENVLACPVCGGTEQSPLMVVNCLTFSHYHPSIHPIRRWVKCAACGHGFANPRPTAAALRQAFQDPPPPHLLPWTYDRLVLCSDIVHDLWSRHPGGDFLDVGTGNGALAGAALDFGYRVSALDIHPGYADLVRRLGVEFTLGDVGAYDFGGRRFDIITLGDVIEHLADPRAALAKMAALLAPEGLIWLSTPNHEGVWTRAMRDRDAMWLEGEHLQYFSLRSLARLFHDQGLQLLDVRLSKRFVGCVEVIGARATKG